MGLFKSKKQRELEKTRHELEKKQAEYASAKAQEKPVLQEYAMLGKKLGELLAGDRVLLYGSNASLYRPHVRQAGAMEICRTTDFEMDWDALLKKCDEFQPTMLILSYVKPAALPGMRPFAEQVVQKHADIVIVALASEPNEAAYVDTEMEKPVILILPRGCNSTQFCGALTAFKENLIASSANQPQA